MQMGTTELRRQRPTAIIAVATVMALAAIGWGSHLIGSSQSEEAALDETPALEASPPVDTGAAPKDGVAPAAAGPPPAAIENCNRYAAEAELNAKKVIGDAVVGGAAGAAVGAAGGAIAGGKDAPGKGAGIGALVGATAGTLYGLSAENERSEAARAAYSECMARGGYAS